MTQEELAGEPTPITRKKVRKGPTPPADLGSVILEVPASIKLISIGKPISNVQATLTFQLDHPVEGLLDILGPHAYAATHNGGYIGEGLFIKEAPLKVDVENTITQKFKATLPRFVNQELDQIATNILPLLGNAKRLLAMLEELDAGWRLNVQTDLPGYLVLHEMQEKFDLTSRASTDADETHTEALDEDSVRMN